MTKPKQTDQPGGRLYHYLRACEREILKDALQRHHGHNTDTARWLGISRRALYDKLRFHGLDGEASALRAEAGIMGPRKVDLPEHYREGTFGHA